MKELLLKGSNAKDAMTTSKIQLKASIIDEVNKGLAQNQKAGELEARDQSSDARIYETVFNALVESAKPWQKELEEFLQIQKPDSLEVCKQVNTGDTKCSSEALEQWRELSLVELRNLSSLARVFFDRESALVQKIINGQPSGGDGSQNLVEWFRTTYLPMRLLKRNNEKAEGQKEAKGAGQEPEQYELWYELDKSSSIELLDKNVCLFLNELTGYGHLYSEAAKAQRKELRHSLLTSALESLKAQSSNKSGISCLSVLEQAQLVSNLMIIQHLINQFNQIEYNRVILSRECYASSIRTLFEYGNQPNQNARFVEIVNEILAQVVKMPSDASQGQAEIKKEASAAKCQSLSVIMIERSLKIFNIVALFLEGEKKRERQLKDIQKRKKELQAARAQKKAEKKAGGEAKDTWEC